MRSVVLPFACAVFLAGGCSKAINSRTFPSYDIIPDSSGVTLNVHDRERPVRMLYMGCGHLLFEYNGEIIVTDPWFSVQPFGPGKIQSSDADYQKYKGAVDAAGMNLGLTKSVWIAHTHYDHMMDIPMLLEKSWPADVPIYGNEFGDNILQHFVNAGQYRPIMDAADPVSKSPASWRTGGSSIRVLPILSDHAPHVKWGPLTVHLMRGKIRDDYFREKFIQAAARTKSKEWREGDVFSFLFDFMDGGRIVYRIFIQTSASHFPLGRPPEDVIRDHPVDVAILCLASSNTVKPYPVDILNALKPAKTVFIHWEDFFRRAAFNEHRLVRLTNFRKIARRMSDSGLPMNKQDYVMPRPGTVITIR
ncbi:MAG: MBL fold metallo-hydrolase [Cytophagales bacterium]|nr:MBL fold metallo-hydrolase [Cytophagales bacterium]